VAPNAPLDWVERIVAVPGVYICNECIELSAAIIEDAGQTTSEESSRRRSQYYDRSTEDILAMVPALLRSVDRVEAELAGWISRLRERGSNWEVIVGAAGLSVAAARHRFEAPPP
jgi:hypothetical protein